MSKRWFTILFLAAAPAAAATPEERGLEIARQVDKANEGFAGEKSEVTMLLINAHGEKAERRMNMQILEGKTDGDKSLSEFQWPADVKGTKMLTWTHKSGDDDQWLYLPSAKRVKRIASNNKSGAFMGSEFAFEDLASQEVEKYTYKFLEEKDLGGRKVWVTERFPVDKRSGYTRIVTYTDQEYMNPLKLEYYDRKNELLKVATFSGYEKTGKLWRFKVIDMDNVQTKKKSVLTWNKRQVNVSLDERLFQSESLEN